MPTLPIRLTGQSYESRSLPISAQRTLNFYLEPVPEGSTQQALLSWPGKKSFSTGSGANRGMFEKPWNDNVYCVNGTSLIKIDSAGTQTDLGTISGTGRCVFAASSSYVYIVSNGLVYRTDGATLTSVTDADLESPNSVAHINQQLIYDGNGGRFVTSDAGDGSVISSNNYATAETYFDDLTRVYVFNQTVFLFGEHSVEPWYNSGTGNPPFDRYEGGQRPTGIAGVHCVTNTDQALYFLGSDATIYRMEGYNPAQISTPAINNAIENYSTISDCFAYSLKFEGQSFVVFSFPTANKTWCYSQETGAWVELSSGVTGGRDLSNGYCYAFNKHLVTDYQGGNVYELDIDTYDDAGSTFIRERVTAPAYSGQLTESDKTVFYNCIKLVINSGRGAVTGQGSDPKIMLSYSDDGGLTWRSELWRSAGALGLYGYEVYWYSLGASKSRIFKIRLSDPIEFHLLRMEADVEIGI